MGNNNKKMNKLIVYLRILYRFLLKDIESKQENVVWKELKKFFAEFDWKYGIYEQDKCIEVWFNSQYDKPIRYRYGIYDKCFYSQANVWENFPVELTSDVFILAQHFNNLLSNGIMIVDIESRSVSYFWKNNILFPYLYKAMFGNRIDSHVHTAQEINWAFQKLVEENEAPAIIIADLLKKKSEEEKQSKAGQS